MVEPDFLVVKNLVAGQTLAFPQGLYCSPPHQEVDRQDGKPQGPWVFAGSLPCFHLAFSQDDQSELQPPAVGLLGQA